MGGGKHSPEGVLSMKIGPHKRLLAGLRRATCVLKSPMSQ